MLVLSRKVDERILIGDNIRVTVVSLRGRQVRIGIEAPPEIAVLRQELCELEPPASRTGPFKDRRPGEAPGR